MGMGQDEMVPWARKMLMTEALISSELFSCFMLEPSWGFPLLGFPLRSSGAMEGLRPALLSLWHVSLGGAVALLHASELVGEGGGSEDLRVVSTCFDFLSSSCAPGQERNDVPQVLVPRYMFLSLWHKDIPLFCLVAVSIFWLSFKYFYHWILQSRIFMLPFNFSLSII